MRRALALTLLAAVGPLGACSEDAAPDPDAQRLSESAQRARERQAEIAAQEEVDRNNEFNGITPAPRPGGETPEPAQDGAGTSAARALLSSADRASFARLAAELPGSAGIAVSGVGPDQPVTTAGNLKRGVAWSTAKVPVAMAAVDAGAGTSADLRAAITASDNAAAERLFAALGGGAAAAQQATAQVRAAGDRTTAIEGDRIRPPYTPFGQTTWTLADQTRFAAGMGCTTAGREILGLMRDTVPGQRWGLGRIGTSPAIKGGWGPGRTAGQGDGWLDRQFGLVRIGDRPIAIAIASAAPNHAAGTAALDRIAVWARTHVDPKAAPKPTC